MPPQTWEREAPWVNTAKTHLRTLLAVLAIVLAVSHTWVRRGAMDADGVSYSDIARAYLRGDWHNALNSYWSPLYSWLLAIGYVIFRPSIEWEFLVAHVINLAAFTGALVAWLWLLREWEFWQGPPAHRVLVEVASFSAITWAGLHLVGLGFTSADMIVLAITIALAAVLVRIRRGASRTVDFIMMGLALAIGFLGKAAFEALIPVILIEAAVLLHGLSDRRLYAAAAIAVLVPLPFVAALSVSKGHLVLSDSGRVNYSSHVTGMSLEGWKENGSWPGDKAKHPISRLLDSPRVTGFEAHPVGTFPLHYDPAWWWEGYPAGVNWPRQLMVLRSNIGYCMTRFGTCPVVILALVCFLAGGALQMRRTAWISWFIWLPGLVMAGIYCIVYTLTRYLAGPFIVAAFSLIAISWTVRLPRWIAAVTVALILVASLYRRTEYVQIPISFVKDIAGVGDRGETADIDVALNLKRAGLTGGDRVAMIGSSIGAPWLSLLDDTVVATVPETIGYKDRTLGRKQVSTFEKSDEFWRTDAFAKRRVFDAFRSVGAKWVFALNVPKWANTTGWKFAGKVIPNEFERRLPVIYYRKLD